MTRLAWLALFSLLLGAPAWSQIHKWVDADGTVHYSDQPPPSKANSQQLRVPRSAPSTDSGAQAGKSLAEQEMEFRKRRIENQEAEAKQQQEAASSKGRQQNCVQARQQLSSLQSGARMQRFNEQGEQFYLDDEQRQSEIEEAQKSADSWCN